MGRPKIYNCVLDTETCPLNRNFTQVFPQNMWVYDIGWTISDRLGNIIRTRSFIVKEIYYFEPEAMESAYYAWKCNMYDFDIIKGDRIITTLYVIRDTLLSDLQEFGIKRIYAHNARFDYGALNNTIRWITKSKYRYFLPQWVEIWDTLKMSRTVLTDMPSYIRFCKKNGYITKNNQLQLKAEVIYRFITKKEEFAECHTGLEDTFVETEILIYCLKHNSKVDGRLFNGHEEKYIK